MINFFYLCHYDEQYENKNDSILQRSIKLLFDIVNVYNLYLLFPYNSVSINLPWKRNYKQNYSIRVWMLNSLLFIIHIFNIIYRIIIYDKCDYNVKIYLKWLFEIN